MMEAPKGLLTPTEFAAALGVPKAVVYSRLKGPDSNYWRRVLGVIETGPNKNRHLLIPADSVMAWHKAQPHKGERTHPQRRTKSQSEHKIPTNLNPILMNLIRRADTVDDPELLRSTFVDVGNLAHLLSAPNHQILFGRRGTGKTHALAMLESRVLDAGDIVVSIDLRRAGSTGAYASKTIPLDQRCTRLLVDVLATIQGRLVSLALSDDSLRSDQLFPLLDRLADTLTTVEVVGTVEVSESGQASESNSDSSAGPLAFDGGPKLEASLGNTASRSTVFERRITESGTPRLDLHFGAVTQVFEDILAAIDGRRIWILLDEWSPLPIELQPVLADFLRRTLLALPRVVVKIAAIEDRSHFRIAIPDGDHMGFELGADISADIKLDDYMIFENDSDRAVEFFATLLARHVDAILPDDLFVDRSNFVDACFTDRGAFRELVRAAEGVPRDAINVVALAAQKAADRKIGTGDVRGAARDWYQKDKEGALKRPEARALLAKIIDEVVGRRKKRSFLLERGSGGSEDYVIRELYDARILHIIRRGLAPADRPSVRYDGFVVDYGCYVDFALADDASVAEFWIGEVPPERFSLVKGSVLDLYELLSS